RLVALKMILAGEYAEAGARARFPAEAEAPARLDHPHILRIFEVGGTRGPAYVVLEELDRGTPRPHCGQPHSPRPVARFVQTLAEAVHYAHERGVVHRDLKPANVLLSVVSSQLSVVREGGGGDSFLTTDNRQLTTVPKIADFGLAKMEGPAGAGPSAP